MNRKPILTGAALCTLFLGSICSQAQELAPEIQAKIAPVIKEMQQWVADPSVVSAVKTQNASLPAAYAEMTQEKWTQLTVLDPFVRSFTQNPAAQFLKAKKTESIGEMFLSDASGKKVAFLSKTSNWCHKGMPKHDTPMNGQNWTGQPSVDSSTGLMLVQVSVPVLDEGKPIGSLVVGIKISQ